LNITTLYDALVTELTNDTGLNSWALLTYGKNHTYINRADRRDGPELEDCPCCTLTPVGKEMSAERRTVFHDFHLDALVYDESASAFANLEAYRKLLQDALVLAIGAMNLFLVDVVVEYESAESYPFSWSGMQMRFAEHVTLGTNPLS
jgi:hypothetical protein